jgi:hypothetical protein
MTGDHRESLVLATPPVSTEVLTSTPLRSGTNDDDNGGRLRVALRGTPGAGGDEPPALAPSPYCSFVRIKPFSFGRVETEG